VCTVLAFMNCCHSSFSCCARRCNVDMLKLIQLGLTFTDAEGNLPTCNGELSVWQFNFKCALAQTHTCMLGEIAASPSCRPYRPSLLRGIASLRPEHSRCKAMLPHTGSWLTSSPANDLSVMASTAQQY